MNRRSASATPPVESPLLTAQEACHYLRVGRSFLTEHRAELGGRKVGTRLLFHRDDLNAYLERVRIAEQPKAAPTPIAAAPSHRDGTPDWLVKARASGLPNPVTKKSWTETPHQPPAAGRALRGRRG